MNMILGGELAPPVVLNMALNKSFLTLYLSSQPVYPETPYIPWVCLALVEVFLFKSKWVFFIDLPPEELDKVSIDKLFSLQLSE